jgi:hypothetical protein
VTLSDSPLAPPEAALESPPAPAPKAVPLIELAQGRNWSRRAGVSGTLRRKVAQIGVDGERVAAGDSIRATDEPNLHFTAEDNAEFILVDAA